MSHKKPNSERVHKLRNLHDKYLLHLAYQYVHRHKHCDRRLPQFDCPTPLKTEELIMNLSGKGLLEQDFFGNTELHRALEEDSDHVVEILSYICPKAATVCNSDGDTPLHYAIELSRSFTVIKHVIAANRLAIKRKDNDGETPLQIAFRTWNCALRIGLKSVNNNKNIQSKSNVELKSEYKTLRDFYEKINLLFQAEIHGNITNVSATTQLEMLKVCLTHPSCPWSFFKLMLDVYPDCVNQQDKDGNFLLHTAATAESSLDRNLYHCQECENTVQSECW
eukprot:CAMPEP_0172513828 /NCGR_PEP_ID=MMETSP1066-20121228/255781_1 /TAXON_ID=671091 /ORGANISM="Coscinodiscus wailesii, Strain CCMP2513" /LENGTH=278 /DNA_ID=CAMNT_0013294263 /DNA_START=50 /DNA_END=883 /DNA_ORIENTATION=+